MQGNQYYYKPLNAKTPYYWIVVRSCHYAQQSCAAHVSDLVCSVTLRFTGPDTAQGY